MGFIAKILYKTPTPAEQFNVKLRCFSKIKLILNSNFKKLTQTSLDLRAPKSSKGINKLPQEILEQIIAYQSPDDTARMSQVCKAYNSIIHALPAPLLDSVNANGNGTFNLKRISQEKVLYVPSLEKKRQLALTSEHPQVLQKLMRDPDHKVKVNISKNRNAQKDVLLYLSEDESQEVRLNVFQHPNTPKDLVHLQAEFADVMTRNKIANKPKTPANIIHNLAFDPHYFVRRGVATNPKVSNILLSMLVKDESFIVREAALGNLEIRSHLRKNTRFYSK